MSIYRVILSYISRVCATNDACDKQYLNFAFEFSFTHWPSFVLRLLAHSLKVHLVGRISFPRSASILSHPFSQNTVKMCVSLFVRNCRPTRIIKYTFSPQSDNIDGKPTHHTCYSNVDIDSNSIHVWYLHFNFVHVYNPQEG